MLAAGGARAHRGCLSAAAWRRGGAGRPRARPPPQAGAAGAPPTARRRAGAGERQRAVLGVGAATRNGDTMATQRMHMLMDVGAAAAPARRAVLLPRGRGRGAPKGFDISWGGGPGRPAAKVNSCVGKQGYYVGETHTGGPGPRQGQMCP